MCAPLRILALFIIIALALAAPAAAQPKTPSPASTSTNTPPAPSYTPPATIQPTPAIPAARAARNVAVITIRGEIDEWTARSVRRRINEAEASGADALVIELDTPGGEGMAMLAISGAIKSSTIRNTVAWINPNAYSAGCVIALACREIVIADNAALGDALPIAFNAFMQLQGLTDAEREKFLGPIMADLIDSARRSGVDEMLVQGFVRQGVELWLVEHKQTGQRLFVTADQYRLAVGEEPQRSVAAIPSITGSVDAKAPPPQFRRPPGTAHRRAGDSPADASASEPDSSGPSSAPAAPPTAPGAAEVVDPAVRYIPAAPQTSPDFQREVDEALDLRQSPTQRPSLAAPEFRGAFIPIEYVSSGQGILTLRTDKLLLYRVAVQKVNSDAELAAFFGAVNIVRLDESWSEHLARFLSQYWVKGLLIAVFLIALFIEMTHPGVVLPGAIAALCLLGLVVPPLLVNLAAWWMVAAILTGIVMIGVELFLLPGMGIFGVAGVVLLFGGLVGTFVAGPQGLFPTTPQSRSDLAWGLVTTVISLIVAGGVIVSLARHFTALPVLGRLVLKNRPADDDSDDFSSSEPLLAAMDSAAPLAVGATGVTITPLRPAGRVQIGDRIVDVVADIGFIDSGIHIRVVSVNTFRTVVETLHEPDQA